MKTAIYGLFDPEYPKVTRYVGRTTNLLKRIQEHFGGRDAKTGAWVRELKAEGRAPSYQILEYVDSAVALEAETKWINAMQNKGLLNVNQVGRLNGSSRFRITELLPWFEVEMRYIHYVLKRCKGNKLAAARVLGIGRQTLYNKLKQAES